MSTFILTVYIIGFIIMFVVSTHAVTNGDNSEVSSTVKQTFPIVILIFSVFWPIALFFIWYRSITK